MYEVFSKEALEIKRQMRRYPEDEALREDYREALKRKQDTKDKLDEAIKKIKVN